MQRLIFDSTETEITAVWAGDDKILKILHQLKDVSGEDVTISGIFCCSVLEPKNDRDDPLVATFSDLFDIGEGYVMFTSGADLIPPPTAEKLWQLYTMPVQLETRTGQMPAISIKPEDGYANPAFSGDTAQLWAAIAEYFVDHGEREAFSTEEPICVQQNDANYVLAEDDGNPYVNLFKFTLRNNLPDRDHKKPKNWDIDISTTWSNVLFWFEPAAVGSEQEPMPPFSNWSDDDGLNDLMLNILGHCLRESGIFSTLVITREEAAVYSVALPECLYNRPIFYRFFD